MLVLSQPALANFSSELYGTLTIWTDEKGREFFKAVDVCSALKLANVSQSLKRYVDSDYVCQFDDGSHRGGKTNYLSEPGLYQLIFSSKTDWAKQFQRWVFEEVLPKLRADGGYLLPNATSKQIRALLAERQLLLDYFAVSSNIDRIPASRVFKWFKKANPKSTLSKYDLEFAVARHTGKLSRVYSCREWRSAIKASRDFQDFPHCWPWPENPSLENTLASNNAANNPRSSHPFSPHEPK